MTKKRKIIVAIISIVLVLLLGLATFFIVSKAEKKDADAAASTTDDRVKFNDGAWLSVFESISNKMILFRLYIQPEILTPESELTINIEGAVEANADIYTVSFSSRLDFTETYTNENRTVVLSNFGTTSTEERLSICVEPINQYKEVRVVATIDGIEAKSDYRSVIYLWERYIADNQTEMGSSPELEKMEYFVDFKPSDDSFEIAEQMTFDGMNNNGHVNGNIYINIPKEYKNLLSSTSILTEIEEGDWFWKKSTHRYERYLFVTFFGKECNPTIMANAINEKGECSISLMSYFEQRLPEIYTQDNYFGTDVSSFTWRNYPNGKTSTGSNYPFSVGINSFNYSYGHYSEDMYCWAGIYKVTEEISEERYLGGFIASGNGGLDTQRKFELVATTQNYFLASPKEQAKKILESDNTLTDNERLVLQEIAGLATDTEEISVVLKYKTNTISGLNITDAQYVFNVRSIYAQNKSLVLFSLYHLTPYYDIAKLNVVYRGDYWENGYYYKLSERVLLQAKDFSYTYDSSTRMGELICNYSDFLYKDLSMKVTNNDPENHLAVEFYTTDVTDVGGTVTLHYNYEDIEEQLHNSAGWLFDFTKDSLRIDNVPDCATVTVGESELTISVPSNMQNELQYLSLQAVAEIVEDRQYAVSYTYKELEQDGREIVEKSLISEPVAMWYSKLVTYNFVNFMMDNGSVINASVSPTFLAENDIEYATPSDIRKVYLDGELPTCNIVVDYTYNTLFVITNNYDSTFRFKQLDKTSLIYRGDEIVIESEIPEGYRVNSFQAQGSDVVIKNAYDYRDAIIEVTTSVNDAKIITLSIDYTDEWFLTINYLESYEDYRIRSGVKDAKPCFAVKKQLTTKVKVADYPDIYKLTAKNVEAILQKDTSILGLAQIDKVNVSYDGTATYTVDLTYSHASLRQIDYDGNMMEIKVPLTSFADWCAAYGNDWSILYLNTPQRTYFQYSNDVERENLYGFFSVAVFKEQVSDLNYWFKNNTGDGNMTVFTHKNVVGSGIYRFFDNLTTKGPITALLGHVGMAFCEIINDDNAMYYSYFFYLDGTTNLSYLSNGGADSADDTDSALGNKVEDIGDTISSWWNDITTSDFWETTKTVLIVVACVIGGVVVIAVICKIIRWARKKPPQAQIIYMQPPTSTVSAPKKKRKKSKSKRK